MNRPINPAQFLLLAVVLFCITCNKHLSETAAVKTDLIGAARSYIDSISVQGHPVNYRAAQPKTIRWDLAQSCRSAIATASWCPLSLTTPCL